MADLIEAEVVRFFPDKGFGFARDLYGEEYFISRSTRAFAALNDAKNGVRLDLDSAGVIRDPKIGADVVLLISEDVAPEDGLHVEAEMWAYRSNYRSKLNEIGRPAGKRRKKRKLQTLAS